MDTSQQIRFFLGSNTQRGFVPLFPQLLDPASGVVRLIILKGGPGTGKSTMMRRVAQSLTQRGETVEFVPCASDPRSLDAILVPARGFAMVDGTAPHMLDPRYPGVHHTILNSGDAWDVGALQANGKRINDLTREISGCHARATAALSAAGALLSHNRTVAEKFVDETAVDRCARILANLLPLRKGRGREAKRLLSAVSTGEVIVFADTVRLLCPTLYTVQDDWGAASAMLLDKLNSAARARGADTWACPCSVLQPGKLDHVLIPGDGVGVTTLNAFHRIDAPNALPIEALMRTIPASANFAAMEDFLARAKELVEVASQQVLRAKLLHDEQERYYAEAMDFRQLDAMLERVLASLED